MNKLYLFLASLLLFVGRAQAQQYGNEWINYSQVYFKIPITQKGVYRIQFEDLQAAGFPVGSDPRTFQLFRRGVEQAIYVQGEGDGTFSAGEYVEFFGVPNDGARDKEWYQPQSTHTNPYVSLFTDESYYFLTVKLGGGAVRRMATPAAPPKGSLSPETYHNEEVLQLYTNYYHVGPAYNFDYSPTGYQKGMTLSFYDMGKGYLQNPIGAGATFNYTLGMTNPVKDAGVNPSITVSLYGATVTAHNLTWSVGPDAATQTSLQTFSFNNYQIVNSTQSVGWDKFGATSAAMKLVSGAAAGDQISLIYYKFTYPQQLNLSGMGNGKAINLRANAGGSSLVQLSNAVAGDQVYDITDPDQVQRISGSVSASVLETVIGNTTQARNLWVNRTAQNVSVSAGNKVTFQNITPANFDYLIITHPSLQSATGNSPNPVQDYAAYRASAAGGSYKPLIANIDFLSDQFNYGEKSGLSIRRFMSYIFGNNGNPKYLFLIGKGLYAQYFRQIYNQSDYEARNLLPTGGWPGSDWMLINGLGPNPAANTPPIPVGRLNATASSHVLTYLNKVKEYESQPFEAWRKNYLNMSGGHTVDERTTFRSYAQGYSNLQNGTQVGAKTSILSKATDNKVEAFDISAKADSGLGVITFFGHSGDSYTDINVGRPSDGTAKTTDKKRYVIMYVNGCEAGNIFLDGTAITTVGTDWLLAPNKGSILFLGSTFLGWPSYLNTYSSRLFTNLGNSPNQSFGATVVNTIKDFLAAYPNNAMGLGHALETTLQGDPAIIPYPFTKTDFSMTPVNNPTTGGTLPSMYRVAEGLVNKDSVRIALIVSNLGIVSGGQMNVGLQRSSPGGRTAATDLGTFAFNPVKAKDTLYINLLKSTLPVNTPFTLTALIDPTNQIDESRKDNNTANLTLEITSALPVRLVSFSGSIVDGKTATLPDVDPAKVPAQVALLRWNTASEETLDGYTLEKTLDFKTWTSVGYVRAKNAASVSYSLYDPTLQVGDNYYRLKIHEQNDPDHYSPTISLQLAPTYDLRTFPNPAHTSTTLSVREVTPGTASVIAYLYSASGTLVWKGKVSGGQTIIPTAELPEGMYQLQVQDGIATHSRKLVVKHK